LKANYQDFERFTPVDIAIAADAEATLPYLIEAIRKLTTAARRSVFKARGAGAAPTNITEGQPGAPREWLVTIKRNF